MGRGKAVAERTTGSGKARSSRTSNLEDLKPRGPRTSCCIWFVRLGVIGRLSDWAFVRLGVRFAEGLFDLWKVCRFGFDELCLMGMGVEVGLLLLVVVVLLLVVVRKWKS